MTTHDGAIALPRVAFKTCHKATTTQTLLSSSDMSYIHQVNDIRVSGTIEGVRLQNIHGTYSNEPKSQEVSRNSGWGWGYSMMPHDMVSHDRFTQRKHAHHGMRQAEMSYGTAPTPTGFRYEPSEAYHPVGSSF